MFQSCRLATCVFVCALFLVSCAGQPDYVAASDTTERLQTTVARMNQWLGTGPKARGWRRFLDLNTLDSLAAKGEQADPDTLRAIHNRFEQGLPSLQHPVFREVSDAIAEQIDQINRSRNLQYADLQFASLQAINRFSQPAATQLGAQRDMARYELQMLKEMYRREYDSRTRAIVFHKLKLNEAIDFLEGLKIEMPPEVSVGKMRSMIGDENKRLEEVIDKIDALPIQMPDEDANEDAAEEQAGDQDVTPPGPDDEDDLKSLEARKEAIEERIQELQKKYADVLKRDRPRLVRRRDAGRELRRIQRRFRALMLEQTNPAFASTRKAVDRFADAYVFGTEDNIQQEFLQQVTELSNRIPDLENPAARFSHAKVGSILQWLEDRQLLSDFCTAVRRRYSNPNAYLSISSRFIQSQTTRKQAQYDRIAEDFLGRFARGLSFSDTTVSVVPIENANQIHASIMLSGTASTDTYVRERSFRIDTSAMGYLSARRDLFANLNGLWATQSSAVANMNTQYDGISSNLGLVQRLAEKSFAKEQGRANAEASRKIRNRLYNKFDSETSTVLDGLVAQLESIAIRAREYASFLPQLYLRSFSDRIEVVARKATRVAIGAPRNPGIRYAGSDIQLRIHESLPSNYLDQFFTGRTFTRSELEAELKALAGNTNLLGDGTQDGQDPPEEFKIEFAKVRPVQIEFSDNRLGVTVTGTRFEQGDDAITTSVAIKAKFRFIRRNGDLFLQPDGAPEIDLSEGEDPDAESIAFAKILENRLAEAIEKSESDGIKLPPNLIPDLPQLEGIDLVQSLSLGLLEFNDGWLYLGWNYQGGVVSTPAVWSEFNVNQPEESQFNEEVLPDLVEPPIDADSNENSEPVIESPGTR